ncbi:MAG: ABC transporter ATP-binding protein [Rudaea sp.]|uniref:ABC transporter ATP-binding protein n=1 Tax=unclassified Rudaea TaxID=2627037 RepID=UPI0010F6393B|nr:MULTISPECIES: ABC transporter ATP-binding protein [unclassified Rudaea]MBN8887922.1 ABC transporter ATP-binding protein [Rudaea sp.]MBR0347021.1 ABC transporter ATP-binding protein [Rudaea sp.]
MASIQLDKIGKSYGAIDTIREIDLAIGDGEFVCLLGPSGCGKTTTLRMIAGLEQPTRGGIRIGGRDVTHAQPKDRNIGMVFQDYALYPHMTIADNIAYPLKVRGVAADARRAQAREVADVLHIADLLDRLPAQISGGQQQRTSLARALVHPADAFLFDEPLSNLDARMRVEARAFLYHLQRSRGMTAVYVTHDQAEAMALSTRIAVMCAGDIVQYAPPLEIYRRPATTFVAGFVGDPPMNLIAAQATRTQAGIALRAGGLEMAPIASWPALDLALERGDRITVGVRPEHLRIAAGDGNRLRGKLFANEAMGPESLVTLCLDDGVRITARVFGDAPVRIDGDAVFAFDAARVTLFDAQGNRIDGQN